MRYHGDLLRSYFDIGTGEEAERHLDTLEALDDRLDAFSDPEHCAIHGSILSEVADIYADPQSLNAPKAEAALAKSDTMYNEVLGSNELAPLAAREIIFNALRRSRASRTTAAVLRPKLHELTALAVDASYGGYFREQKHRVGFTSEMLGLAVPLWLTLERPEVLGEDQSMIGWPSYVRQDRARVDRLAAGDGVLVLPKSGFDIRLSTYDGDGTELAAQRKKIQVKSRATAERYDPSIVVTPVWGIGNIKRPAEAVFLAASLGKQSDELYTRRLRELKQFVGGFLEYVDIDCREQLLAV